MIRSKKTACAVIAAFCLSFAALADDSMNGNMDSMNKNMPAAANGLNSGASLSAKLLDQDKEARIGAAEIQVKVKNIKLVDPSKNGDVAKNGQGHLHYQVDSGPIVATPTDKIEFHGLTPGKHTITVTLANNDHTPIGMSQSLELTVPETGAAGVVGDMNNSGSGSESSSGTNRQ